MDDHVKRRASSDRSGRDCFIRFREMETRETPCVKYERCSQVRQFFVGWHRFLSGPIRPSVVGIGDAAAGMMTTAALKFREDRSRTAKTNHQLPQWRNSFTQFPADGSNAQWVPATNSKRAARLRDGRSFPSRGLLQPALAAGKPAPPAQTSAIWSIRTPGYLLEIDEPFS